MSRMSELHAEIGELYCAGMLYNDIAETLEIPIEWVYEALNVKMEELEE